MDQVTRSRVVIILTTVPSDVLGEEIATALVSERLAACVNIGSPMTSIYRWKGSVEREAEHQLTIKTTEERVGAVQRRIKEVHSYELPEFLVIAVADGSDQYLKWILSASAEERH
jgi:periplasmic divalent cation tolerance protein